MRCQPEEPGSAQPTRARGLPKKGCACLCHEDQEWALAHSSNPGARRAPLRVRTATKATLFKSPRPVTRRLTAPPI
ncbi:hypothetical protein NDU88_006407 [Pleurodeles waltl]|uniref:Uncharacterized protein n=1 Tax=Pleurodeles waltl TaxID=8319 RepID=A0AAV7LSI7_PLEWA|nr:hypothetical protein NDU88_006407 [Pleurodeles waltl]